jgi:hypothetical protein
MSGFMGAYVCCNDLRTLPEKARFNVPPPTEPAMRLEDAAMYPGTMRDYLAKS